MEKSSSVVAIMLGITLTNTLYAATCVNNSSDLNVAGTCSGNPGLNITGSGDINNPATVTIQSNATVSGTSYYASRITGADYASLINYGTIRGAPYALEISNSKVNQITNHGSIVSVSGTGGTITVNSTTTEINEINNYGSIGGSTIGIRNQGAIINTITNTGTISSSGTGTQVFGDIVYTSGSYGTINNLQGGSDALTYRGSQLPTNYNVIINGTEDFGKIEFGGVNSASQTRFGISDLSGEVIQNTYSAVVTGLVRGQFSNTVGSDGEWGIYNDGERDFKWQLVLSGSANNIWDLVILNLGPSSADTLASFRPNAFALRNVFNLQSAKIAQGLSYDCTVYDQKNICVSFAGSKSDGKGFDATTGALIIAHKPTNNLRFGGYIDQSFGSSTSGGLTTKKGNPGFGAFAVWSQHADGSGVQVRAAANVGKVDIETTREAIESAEAGFGKSNIKSQGFSLEVSNDYAINSMWSARPYVGYRKTTNTRAGYTETQGAESPLTYGSLKQKTETVTAGATFAHTLSAKTTLFLTAGIEHDLKNSIGRYAATSPDIEGIDSIDMGSNKTKTRPTVSFALNHDIDKTQRVGVSLTHRKEAFASGSTTSAFLQYSKGF